MLESRGRQRVQRFSTFRKWEVALGKQFKLTTADKHSLGASRTIRAGNR